MKILHLTLKKKWFDMIASGEKKEEYREWKPYWSKRLLNSWERVGEASFNFDFKEFDYIIFKNGYAKNAPTIKVECLGITIGRGNYHWGALMQKDMYVIKLGAVIS